MTGHYVDERFFMELELSVRQRIIRGKLMIGVKHECSNSKYGDFNPNQQKNIEQWLARREQERIEGDMV